MSTTVDDIAPAPLTLEQQLLEKLISSTRGPLAKLTVSLIGAKYYSGKIDEEWFDKAVAGTDDEGDHSDFIKKLAERCLLYEKELRAKKDVTWLGNQFELGENVTVMGENAREGVYTQMAFLALDRGLWCKTEDLLFPNQLIFHDFSKPKEKTLSFLDACANWAKVVIAFDGMMEDMVRRSKYIIELSKREEGEVEPHSSTAVSAQTTEVALASLIHLEAGTNANRHERTVQQNLSRAAYGLGLLIYVSVHSLTHSLLVQLTTDLYATKDKDGKKRVTM